MAIKQRQSATAAKRQSTSSAAGDAKKRRTALQQCSAVSKAVLTSEEFPQKVLKMVSEHLDKCLGVPKEDRHEFQEKVIQMAGHVLNGVEASVSGKIGAAQATLSSTEAGKAARDEASEKAAGEVTLKVEAFEVAKASHTDSTTHTRVAKAGVSEAVSAQDENNSGLEKATSKKTQIENALNEAYTPLKDGSSEASYANSKKRLRQLGKDCKVELDMLECLEKTLQTAPESRGTFDVTVCSNFESSVKNQMTELEEKISTCEAAKAGHDAKVAETTAALETARGQQESCKNTMDEKKVALLEAKEAHSAATQAVTNFRTEMKEVEVDLASAKATLDGFVNGPLAAYKELLDYTTIQPPTPAQAPDAEMQATQ